MQASKKEKPRSCGKASYDLEGWEGGLAVFWVDGDYATKIVAVPRISLSTCLLGNATDRYQLIEMLYRNRNFNHNRKQAEFLADSILRDMKELKVV